MANQTKMNKHSELCCHQCCKHAQHK